MLLKKGGCIDESLVSCVIFFYIIWDLINMVENNRILILCYVLNLFL